MESVLDASTKLWTDEYQREVIDALKNGKHGKTLSNRNYHILKTYNLVSLGGVERVARKKGGKYMITKNEALNVIRLMHQESGHAGERKTHKKIQDQYDNITRGLVREYINRCERCCEKRKKTETSSGVVIQPILVNDLNDRGQIDLVDFQTCADGSYRYILHYVEYLTKYHILRPLKSKTAIEVARELLNIFLDFGAPHVLQSDNGREFTASVISELSKLWPNLTLVNGRPRHPQSQGCVERSNGDMKNKIQSWMRDNDTTNWSLGIRFIQWQMNTTYHEAIRTKPYMALTGNEPRCGLISRSAVFISRLGCSDIREEVLEHLIQESENSADTPDTNEEFSDTDELLADIDEDLAETVEDLAEGDNTLENIEHNEDDYDEIVIPSLEQDPAISEHPAKRGRSEDCSNDGSDEEVHPAKKARAIARAGIQKQAARMLARSKKSLRPLAPLDNVAVPVSQYDRSKGDPPNVLGVIMSVHNCGYVVGTKSGVIKGKMARNQIEFIKFAGITDEDVPSVELSLHEIVRAQSICGGQGYQKCNCQKGNCKKKELFMFQK